MADADGNGQNITIVNAGGEETGGLDEGGEVQGAAEVAEVADAAVEVARIEAERDITIAAIEADAGLEHHELGVREMEALSEVVENSELEQCRTRIAELEASNTVLLTELEALRAPSIPPSSEEPPPNPQPSPEVEVSVSVDPEDRPEAEKAPEPQKPRRKSLRWI